MRRFKNEKFKVLEIEKMSFEEAYDELNKIVDFIESGDVSLDDSIKVYEMGIKLKIIVKKLKDAEIKLKKLLIIK